MGLTEDALQLALRERLGREARDEDEISDRDEERAEQILQFWTKDLAKSENRN